MPAPSYAVHAWEEELGVTLLGLGLQSFKAQGCKYDGGYPFKAVNPSKKNLFNHQKSLDDSLKVIEEAKKKSLAENVLVFNHYPLHWHGRTYESIDTYVVFFSFLLFLAEVEKSVAIFFTRRFRPLRPGKLMPAGHFRSGHPPAAEIRSKLIPAKLAANAHRT